MSYISSGSLSRLSMSIAANQLVMSVKSPFRQWFPDPSAAGSNVEKLVTAASWTINGDGHASENFKMGLWGVTHAAAADDWDSDTMACVHLGVSTTGVVFPCIGRKWLDITPAASAIGSLSAAPTGGSSQGNCFIPLALADDAAKGDYDACPLIPYGTFRMQKFQADATHWALPTAITLGYDGWGLFNSKTWWTFQPGLNGAVTGYYSNAPGSGNQVQWSTSNYLFKHDLDNNVDLDVALSGDGGTDGSDAGTQYKIYTPFIPATATKCIGHLYGNAAAKTPALVSISTSGYFIIYQTDVGDSANFNFFPNGGRYITVNVKNLKIA